MIWILRCLALCHFGWGGVLLLAAVWSVWSAFRALPFMSTGTIWTNLPAALAASAIHATIPTVLGVWMFILGRRLWSPDERLRTMLLRAHSLLFAIGSLAVYSGIHSVEAMERSTARGGGLLGPLAYVPLLFGIPLVALAFCSLVMALLVLPWDHPGNVPSKNVSPTPPVWSIKTILVLLALMLMSAFVLINGLRPIWPAAQHQMAVERVDAMPVRTTSEIAALQALVRLGAQAEPVVDELKRVGKEYWKNPATAALSLSVDQTVEEIEKKLKKDASRSLE